MQSLVDWWNGVLEIPGAGWIIYPSLLIVLILIAWYVLQMFRDMAIGSTESEDYLGSFRKMRDDGMIAAEEYKKVAGLVPLPEMESKDNSGIRETGADALAEAAKAAIQKSARKSAQKNAADSPGGNDAPEDGDHEHSTES